jgi:hypothetical protein
MFIKDVGQSRGRSHDSPLHRLLYESRFHRLHPGLVLVGLVRLEPSFVLDLSWREIDLSQGWIDTDAGRLRLPPTVTALLQWHAARQRMDCRRAAVWPGASQVLLDEFGIPFSDDVADAVVGGLCDEVGLPRLPFSSLRHPCLR